MIENKYVPPALRGAGNASQQQEPTQKQFNVNPYGVNSEQSRPGNFEQASRGHPSNSRFVFLMCQFVILNYASFTYKMEQ